jgi:hypothetical protein
VPISPGKILAGYLLNKKNGIITAIAIIDKINASKEFQRIAQIKIKDTAIKQVPLPSPLYPSNILTVLANTATIIGTKKGYKIVNLVEPKNGITGEDISINLK